MAIYKQNCIRCGALIDRDTHRCPKCGSRSPFGYHCPTCLREIDSTYAVCPSCGRVLHIMCPFCGEQTFADERCDKCGESLLVQCTNKNCREMQFFENTKCTSCGKKIKVKL